MGLRIFAQTVGSVLGLFALVGCSSADSDDQPTGGAGGSGGAAGSNVGGLLMNGGNAGSGAGISGSGGSVGGTTGGAGSGGKTLGGSGSGGAAAGHHLSIRFDYRFDTLGYFDAPERRAALEVAGAVWSNLLQNDFETVPQGSRIRLRNPENRDEYVWVEGIEEEIDDLVVFVGTSEAILGLGRGGPSGTAETGDLAADADLALRRDGDQFEPWAGSISFKASSNFFFDATPETADDIPFEAFDFISNATHELGHVLGFANCVAFTNFVTGTSFNGPAAVAEFGGPVPLDPAVGHFADHTESDGRETLMDPGQSNSLRYAPTSLDLAVLADIGYQIAK